MGLTEPTFLPRPRQVEPRDGTFALDAATKIQIGPGPSAATADTARGLQTALADLTGITVPIVPTAAPDVTDAITLVLIDRDAPVFSAGVFGWSAPTDGGDQSYTVAVQAGGATVAAHGEPGLFYGVQTLIQLARSSGRVWPALAIDDAPVLPNRGLMLDISRRKVPTMATLERLVRTLAHYKYNQLQLYIEHTFHFPRHPEIGAGADPIAGDDILALDRLCRAHHIDLVPNFQAMGHQREIFALPQYAHLAETPWNWAFDSTSDEAFAFVDELIGDLLPAFSSRWLNVDADEPWDLGRGKSAKLTEEIGVGRVYLGHVKRLHEITQRHGRQMMMWADMFWHYPELVPEFPDDIVLLDWWYEPKEHFETVDVLAKANRRFYVCPGTSSWSSLFPRLENAIANVQVFVRDGVAAGAEGMLMTDWGDYGHYQLLSHSWYPYLWAAECAWTGGTTPADGFDAAFDRLFLADGSGTVMAALRRLGAAMAVDPSWMVTWNSAMALFEDPLAGHLATTVDPAVVAEARAAAGALLPLLDRVRDAGIRHDLGYTAAQIRFAADKIDLSRAIRHLLRDIARETAPTDAGRARLDELIGLLRRQRDALPALIAEFEIRWLAHARRSEVAVNLDRFARLLARHDAALTWLDTQRTAYQAGHGIDGALATYEVGDYGVIWQESLANVNRLAEIVGEEAIPPDIRRWRAALLNPPTEDASIAAERAPTSKGYDREGVDSEARRAETTVEQAT